MELTTSLQLVWLELCQPCLWIRPWTRTFLIWSVSCVCVCVCALKVPASWMTLLHRINGNSISSWNLSITSQKKKKKLFQNMELPTTVCICTSTRTIIWRLCTCLHHHHPFNRTHSSLPVAAIPPCSSLISTLFFYTRFTSVLLSLLPLTLLLFSPLPPLPLLSPTLRCHPVAHSSSWPSFMDAHLYKVMISSLLFALH